MDFNELKRQWQALDGKLDAVLRFEARLARDAVATRTRGLLRSEQWRIWPSLVMHGLVLVLLGSFIGDHLRQPRFLVPAILLDLSTLSLLWSDAYQLVLLARLDYDAPVLENQRLLETLRLVRLRVLKWVLTVAPLLWTPLFIVALKALFGLDVYAAFGLLYILANVLFGVVAIPILLWLARYGGERVRRRPRLQRLLDDLAGKRLNAAIGYLESLDRFRDEP